MWHAQQIANDFHRNGAGKVFNQIAAALSLHVVQQVVDQLNQPGGQVVNRSARERAHDQLAHPGVQWRVVEHQAVRVVLVQRRSVAGQGVRRGVVGRFVVLGAELHLLVGAEGLRIAVHRHQVSVAG